MQVDVFGRFINYKWKEVHELKRSLLFYFYFLLMLAEQNNSKRECQSMALLQKLIRLDSKDCNFHFKDNFRGVCFKVSYPLTNTDNNSNEGLLRQLWHHIWAHYFKKLEHQELKRFEYLHILFISPLMGSRGGRGFGQRLPLDHAELFSEMEMLYDQSYLQQLLREAERDKEVDIWLKTLYLNAKVIKLTEQLGNSQRKKCKIIYSKLKQNRKLRRRLKTKKVLLKSLQEDEDQIDSLLLQLEGVQNQHESEIDREIRELEQELSSNSDECVPLVNQLQEKIDAETEDNNRSYYRSLMTNSNEQSPDNAKDFECLEYLIRCLEQKQIAESVAKIIATERSKGEIMFQVAYEKAINIEPRLITEKELSRVNFLRETSLVQFYRTGVKSPYSYICHNYVGFRELMQNRMNITARFKEKCMVQMMKKGACLASIGEIQYEMAKFNMCHHCKFLFPDYLLFTCKFSSDKQAIPKVNLETVCDPNLAQTFQEGPNRGRTSQRFMTRRKNCLTSYAKIHDQYVCGRKYCFSCLKDSYSHENIRENGLCPFCLGVCICTRCLRNEKIAKFKNMYSSLGGDLAKIQEGSNLEQLQAKGEEPIQRGRGRPKKYTLSHITVNIAQKKLRKLDEKQNYILPPTLLSRSKRKTQAYNHWKRNDSVNDTQEQSDPKRKKKRGVGRPRIEKPDQQYKRKLVKCNDR